MIDTVLDFTNNEKKNKTYGGANGNKISIIHNNKMHMLKFPTIPTRETNISYIHNCYSEYIGCHIYDLLGFKVQKTTLGVYMTKNKLKFVVACEDFTKPGIVLQDFASMKNQIIDSKHSGYGTNIDEVIEAIEKQTAVDAKQLKKHFWNMFIVDAFIGNWDRHNGNWGFLYNTQTDNVEIAPIYDCGSCLYPQIDEEMMINMMHNKKELEKRIYNVPTSTFKKDNKRINYFEFISSLENNDCNEALMRIVPKINLDKIYEMIDKIPLMPTIQQSFYKKVLKERKEKILDYSYNKLIKLNN